MSPQTEELHDIEEKLGITNHSKKMFEFIQTTLYNCPLKGTGAGSGRGSPVTLSSGENNMLHKYSQPVLKEIIDSCSE